MLSYTKYKSKVRSFAGKYGKKCETRGRKRKFTYEHNINTPDVDCDIFYKIDTTPIRKATKCTQTIVTMCKTDTLIKCASRRKLNYFSNFDVEAAASSGSPSNRPTDSPTLSPTPSDSSIPNDNVFGLIHLRKLNTAVSDVLCPNCKRSTVKFEFGRTLGLSVALILKCVACDKIISELQSSPHVEEIGINVSRQPYEINKRAVLAMREVGLGSIGLNKIMGILNITGSLHHKSYSNINKLLHSSITDITKQNNLHTAHAIIRKAYAEVNPAVLSDDVIDIGVSFDGSWHKRGHTSHYGVGFAIDNLTGLIVDYEVLSKYCAECELVGSKLEKALQERWEAVHADKCDKNYEGSSGGMEAEIGYILWKRSIDVSGFRYTTLISDGDAKTHSLLVKLNVYGDEHPIVKEECINHIQKRMYTGLDKIAKCSQAQGLSVRGKGKLTRDRMLKWQSYYRNAIVNNTNMQDMQNAIWAIFFHSISLPDEPHHERCGDWCYYQKALKQHISPEEIKKLSPHDPPIPKEIAEKMLGLFKRLSDEELLKRCVRSRTQNANESLHSVLWRKIPKINFVSRKSLEIGAALAACEFNKGAGALCDTIKDMGFEPGENAERLVCKTNQKRLSGASCRSMQARKDARKEKKISKALKEDKNKNKEGLTYGAGEF